MASENAHPRTLSGLGTTARRDAWWVGPSVTFVIFSAFIVYGGVRAIYNDHYLVDNPESAHILAPFYSPLILIPGMPAWFSPAFLILWAPGGFRLTCYYYRKAYYRSFFWDPPACAVGEMRGTGYKGETALLLFQNLHRYLLIFAIALVFILTYDAILACIWPVDGGGHTFGMSVATVIMFVNSVCLAGYTFGCHSFRHLIGGKLDCFTCSHASQTRFKLWKGVTILNNRHMFWAWLSLFTVVTADVYVWLVAAGQITDYRIF